MQLPRPNTVALLALMGASLTLAGCDSLYDRTKGWANDLDAAIGEEWDRMAASRKKAAEDKEAADAHEAAAPASSISEPAPPPEQAAAAPEVRRTTPTQSGPRTHGGNSMDRLVASDGLLMPPRHLWPSLKPQPDQGPEQIEGPDRIATANVPPLSAQREISQSTRGPTPKEVPSEDITPQQAGAPAEATGEKDPTTLSESETKPSDLPAQTSVSSEASSRIAIHLSSLSSEEKAKGHWSALQEAFPGTLRDLVLDVQRADLGDRGIFYRVLAGPFASQSEAKRTCEELKALRQYCRVTDTGPSA